MLTIATTNAYEFLSFHLLFRCYSCVDLLTPPPMCATYMHLYVSIYVCIDVHGDQRLILEAFQISDTSCILNNLTVEWVMGCN